MRWNDNDRAVGDAQDGKMWEEEYVAALYDTRTGRNKYESIEKMLNRTSHSTGTHPGLKSEDVSLLVYTVSNTVPADAVIFEIPQLFPLELYFTTAHSRTHPVNSSLSFKRVSLITFTKPSLIY